jgi:hypothetical protein
MPSLNFTLGVAALEWTLIIVFAFLVTLILFMRSGHGYSVQDTEAHSVNFAGVIREGHGGLTAFMWTFYIFMFIWTIVYLVQHSSEFAIIFSAS